MTNLNIDDLIQILEVLDRVNDQKDDDLHSIVFQVLANRKKVRNMYLAQAERDAEKYGY